MTEDWCQPEEPLEPNRPPIPKECSQLALEARKRLLTLDDELYKLLSCHRFYHASIQAILEQEPESFDREWLFGLFTLSEMLSDKGDALILEFRGVMGWLDSVKVEHE